jgi:selenoprotein W-related protein
MTEEILADFGPKIDEWTVIPSKGGVFEVVLGDELIYSKKETGRHATVEEVREAFAARLG